MNKVLSQKALIIKIGIFACAILAVLAGAAFATGCTSSPQQETNDEQISAQPDGDTSAQTDTAPQSDLVTSLTPDEGVSYSLYFGLIDKDTGKQELATAEYREAIAEIFIQAGVGYTVYEAFGAYPLEDGTVVENVTLVFTGVHGSEEAVQALITNAQSVLNLESVYCESYLHGYGISGGVVKGLD